MTLIERLRERKFYEPFVAALLDEAADEIERLRQEYDQLQNKTSDQYDEQQAEIEQLRAALDEVRELLPPISEARLIINKALEDSDED